MQDKLRKFIERLWYFKERLVLIIMVGILGWNVYRVATAPEMAKLARHQPPKTENDGTLENPPLPAPAAIRMPGQWKSVYTPSPFWYYSSPTEGNAQKKGDEDPGIKLVRIQKMPNGKMRAQLKTGSTKWYNEGAKFESFELMKIDADNNSCQVYSERLGKVVVLTVSGS